MDLVTYALLKKQLSQATSNIESEIENKVAVIDAGLTPVASVSNGKTRNSMNENAWNALCNEEVDVFATVDGVLKKMAYTVNADDVRIVDGKITVAIISDNGNGKYYITWGDSYTDIDISMSEKGLIRYGAMSHICSSSEYNSETRVPVITEPLDNVIYFVPSELPNSTNAYVKWVYINNNWEKLSEYVDLSEYVKNTNYATNSNGGILKVHESMKMDSNGCLYLRSANSLQVKNGVNMVYALTPSIQHESTFYGLAKAAGDATQSTSTNAVGTYTEEAKASIKNMLGVIDPMWEAGTGINAIKAKSATSATGDYAIAEGYNTNATGRGSHTEGSGTTATNYWSHAEGALTQAHGYMSHTEGNYTIAQRRSQHVSGEFNIPDTSGENTDAKGLYLEIIGNGTDDNTRSNARTLDWSGNEYLAGDVYVNCTSDGTGGSRLGTREVIVSETAPTITADSNTRYVCGEVTSLSFTPSSSGICDVIFTSGATAATLILPSTVKMPDWFDSTSLSTNTTYEINIMDGVYGVVMSWTV